MHHQLHSSAVDVLLVWTRLQCASRVEGQPMLTVLVLVPYVLQ
jgi:hypothetical protein